MNSEQASATPSTACEAGVCAFLFFVFSRCRWLRILAVSHPKTVVTGASFSSQPNIIRCPTITGLKPLLPRALTYSYTIFEIGRIRHSSFATLSSSCRFALIDGGSLRAFRLSKRFCRWLRSANKTSRLILRPLRVRRIMARCSIRFLTVSNGKTRCAINRLALGDCTPTPEYSLPGSMPITTGCVSVPDGFETSCT